MKRLYPISLLILTVLGCKSNFYYAEINHNGIGRSELKKSVFNKQDGAFSSDGIYTKKVILSLGDTIRKRCFTYSDLERIKHHFSCDSLLCNLSFSLRPYSPEDLKECSGLYIIRFVESNSNYIEFPLLKVRESILVNLKTKEELKYEFISETKRHAEEGLKDKFDLTEVNKRMEVFFYGRRIIPFADFHIKR